MLRKKLNVFTSQVHKEMTPGNKRLHFEHARSLKAILKQYNINIFRDGPARNLRLVEKLIKKLLMVFDMCRRRWKQTFQGFCPGEISGGRKNHSLNLLEILKARLRLILSKIKNWDREEKEDFKILISPKGGLRSF